MQVADVDRVLQELQSPDGGVRQRAEAVVAAWSDGPLAIQLLLPRVRLAPTLASRQLAATLLAWRLPIAWGALAPGDRDGLQASLLETFASSDEAPVLRALSEACNSLAQTVALKTDSVWEQLLRWVSTALSGGSLVHRRAALELLAALVDSLGARLHPFYASMGKTLAAGPLQDTDVGVRVAALAASAALAGSWCATETDLNAWFPVAVAVVDAASEALQGCVRTGTASADAPEVAVLSAALRALRHLTRLLDAAGVACRAVEVAVGCMQAPVIESCRSLALQVLRAFAKRQPHIFGGGVVGPIVIAVVGSIRADESGRADGEASHASQAAKDCLKSLARRVDGAAEQMFSLAAAAAQSPEPADRAAGLHAVACALAGARELPSDWATPLAAGVGDNVPAVRATACGAAELLAEALKADDPAKARGLQQLLQRFAQQLSQERVPEVIVKLACAMKAAFTELTSDEAIPTLPAVAPALIMALRDARAHESASALAEALAACAASASDGFGPFAREALTVLLPALRAGDANSETFCVCLAAAGPVLAATWGEPELQSAREEAAGVALRVLSVAEVGSEARVRAHGFFGCVAFAAFEGFAPHLPAVVPPAVAALQADDPSGQAQRRRAVWTGVTSERIAAIEALGRYASACGAGFAPQLPGAWPPLLAQAQHPRVEVRAAAMAALGQVSGVLDQLSSAQVGAADRAALEGVACGLAAALRKELAAAAACSLESSSAAARAALFASQDALARPGFVSLAGGEGEALAGLCSGLDDEDIESTEDAGSDDGAGDEAD